jgi:hypothetical protein
MRTYYEKQILVPVPKTGLYPKKLVYKFGPGKPFTYLLFNLLFRRARMDSTAAFGASVPQTPAA